MTWAAEYFRPFVQGTPFKVFTDHNNLRWLLDAKWTSGKLARWALRLGEYDMTIQHTKGSLNVAADALSRYPSYGRPIALSAMSPNPPSPVINNSTLEVLPRVVYEC